MPCLPNTFVQSCYATTTLSNNIALYICTFFLRLIIETDHSWICNNGRKSIQHNNVLPNYPIVHNARNSHHLIVISYGGNTRSVNTILWRSLVLFVCTTKAIFLVRKKTTSHLLFPAITIIDCYC